MNLPLCCPPETCKSTYFNKKNAHMHICTHTHTSIFKKKKTNWSRCSFSKMAHISSQCFYKISNLLQCPKDCMIWWQRKPFSHLMCHSPQWLVLTCLSPALSPSLSANPAILHHAILLFPSQQLSKIILFINLRAQTMSIFKSTPWIIIPSWKGASHFCER